MSLIENLSLQNLSYDDCSTLITELQELKRQLKSVKSLTRLENKLNKKIQTDLKKQETMMKLQLKLDKLKSKSIYKNSDVTLIDVSEYNKELV